MGKLDKHEKAASLARRRPYMRYWQVARILEGGRTGPRMLFLTDSADRNSLTRLYPELRGRTLKIDQVNERQARNRFTTGYLNEAKERAREALAK